MRIHVKSGNRTVRIVIPTCLVFSRMTAWLGARYGLRYAGDAVRDLTPEQLNALFAEFRRIKRKHGKWDLVDVESADGTATVKVTL